MMQELNYIRCGDYYIPDIRLPKETRPIDTKPTVEDFKKTVSDYLAWEVSTLLKNQPSENERLGK